MGMGNVTVVDETRMSDAVTVPWRIDEARRNEGTD